MNSLLQRGARGGGQRTHRVPERADCHVHHWSFLEWVPCHVVLREALVDVELSNQDSIAVVTYGYTVFTDGSVSLLFLPARLPSSSSPCDFLFLTITLWLVATTACCWRSLRVG